MACCAKCDERFPPPKWHGPTVNEALLQGYAIRRQRYRAEHPHVSRDALALAEGHGVHQ